MSFYNLDQADWHNIIYLALILTVLVLNLLSRGNLDFKKNFKHFSAWLIVALLAVALYSYRYEFSDFKNRILGEINPSSPQISDSGKIIINISQDQHFYIDVMVNKMSMRFMIDTGASDVVIGLQEAAILGIDLKKLLFNKRYQTANGIAWGANIMFDEVMVGNIKFNNISASVNNADMGTPLLGMSFLRRFKKYEFYRDKLILTI